MILYYIKIKPLNKVFHAFLHRNTHVEPAASIYHLNFVGLVFIDVVLRG